MNESQQKMAMKWNESMQPILFRISIGIGDGRMQFVLSGLADFLTYWPGSLRHTRKTDCRSPVSEWLVDDIMFHTQDFAEIADVLL